MVTRSGRSPRGCNDSMWPDQVPTNYAYIYMYICICIYIYTYVYIYICIYIYVYICIYIYVYIYMCVWYWYCVELHCVKCILWYIYNMYLVRGAMTILKNDGVRQWLVDDIPYMKWKIIQMFETTNQVCIYIYYIYNMYIICILYDVFGLAAGWSTDWARRTRCQVLRNQGETHGESNGFWYAQWDMNW